jgi:hypothetical protein
MLVLVLKLQAAPGGNFTEALQYCFKFLAIASVFQQGVQGNSCFSGELSGRVKARIRAEHAILRAISLALRASPRADPYR